jgi:hypothetical protein
LICGKKTAGKIKSDLTFVRGIEPMVFYGISPMVAGLRAGVARSSGVGAKKIHEKWIALCMT